MRQFYTIALNAFMELIRQPIFLLLMTTSAVFEIFLASVNYFGFGDEPKLVKNSVLAAMFLAGLFAAVLSASASVAREIRSGTALAVLSKPVGRAKFLMAKYVGLAAALTALTWVNMLCALLASRMAFDAYGSVDIPALSIFLGSVILGYAIAGFTNFFLRRPFMADAVLSLICTITIGFVIVALMKKDVPWTVEYKGMDWRLIPASVLILFALWILAAIAIAASTRMDMISTLAICTGFFLVGLISDYLFGTRAEKGVWWAQVLYAAIPNWQLFWIADVIQETQKVATVALWGYVAKASGYVVAYVAAAMAIALAMFEERELS